MNTIQKHQNNGYRVVWWVYLEALVLFTIFTITIKFGFLALVLALIATIYLYKVLEKNNWQTPQTLIVTISYLKTSSIILAEFTGKIVASTYRYAFVRLKQLWYIPKSVTKTQNI